MSNIWFTADEHYGHENARTGWGDPAKARPFSSVEEMTGCLVRNHNAVVGPDDVTYHLGDMFWRTLSWVRGRLIMSALKGRHCYVLGNHEEFLRTNPTVRDLFEWVEPRVELTLLPAQTQGVASQLVVLDHYAGRVWNGSHRGSWQLHGHSHGALPDAGLLQMDVGVDCNGFAPVSLGRVVEVMRAKGAR